MAGQEQAVLRLLGHIRFGVIVIAAVGVLVVFDAIFPEVRPWLLDRRPVIGAWLLILLPVFAVIMLPVALIRAVHRARSSNATSPARDDGA